MEGVIYCSSGGDGTGAKTKDDTDNSSVGDDENARMDGNTSSSIASDESWTEVDEAAEKALEKSGKRFMLG